MTRTATETRRQIDRAGNMIHDGEVTIAELEARRADLLTAVHPVGSFAESAAREELDTVEAALAESRLSLGRLRDSVEVMTGELPSPAQVAAAEGKAAELSTAAAGAAADAVDAWVVLAAGLADVVEAAGRYAESSRAQRVAQQERRTVAEQYAIDPPALELEAISAEELRAALTLLTAVSQAIRGGGVSLVAGNALEELLTPLRARLELAEEAGEAEAEGAELPLFQGEEAAA